jgi:hypothetical protein
VVDDKVRRSNGEITEAGASDVSRWACPWHEQMVLLLRRSLATRRGQLFDALKLGQALAVALMVGALWWGPAPAPVAHVTDSAPVTALAAPGPSPAPAPGAGARVLSKRCLKTWLSSMCIDLYRGGQILHSEQGMIWLMF